MQFLVTNKQQSERASMVSEYTLNFISMVVPNRHSASGMRKSLGI